MSDDALLSVTLIPETAHFRNLRRFMTRETWDKIAQEIKHGKTRCDICAARKPLCCHTLWIFDDELHLQIFNGFEAICRDCLDVRHIGMANCNGRGAAARRHLMIVNGWSNAAVSAHVVGCKEQYRQRSKVQWTIDLTLLERDYADVELQDEEQ